MKNTRWYVKMRSIIDKIKELLVKTDIKALPKLGVFGTYLVNLMANEITLNR
jgi:hypothetical protein